MRDDALPGRRFALAAGGFALVVALAITTVLLLLSERHVPRGGVPVAPPAALPAGDPMLQTAPQDDLAAYRRQQAAALDRADATHVPIEAAMAGLVRSAASGVPAAEARP